MKRRRVNKDLLERWILENGPDGISRLAVLSKVSASTLNKARYSGIIPKKPITLEAISRAVGYEVDDVFPVVKEQAS